MVTLLEKVVAQNVPAATRSGYRVGGKTGTAEFTNPNTGEYYKDRFNGTYMGFAGGDKPEYVIIVLVNEPKIPGFAGSAAAAPIFRDITNMLFDNFGLTPKE
jgi:cell division protein FtsI/penicillin-binding protein 2